MMISLPLPRYSWQLRLRSWQGSRWGVGPLHAILTRATYKGEHRFNRKVWKTRQAKPESEQIGVIVEPIIEEATFDAAQASLKLKNPRVTPPRVVTGPILLTASPPARAAMAA
jgi:hypothetical protein